MRSTISAVAVAMPPMRCMKLRAIRSATRMLRALPVTVPNLVPAATRAPSLPFQCTDRQGSTAEKTCKTRVWLREGGCWHDQGNFLGTDGLGPLQEGRQDGCASRRRLRQQSLLLECDDKLGGDACRKPLVGAGMKGVMACIEGASQNRGCRLGGSSALKQWTHGIADDRLRPQAVSMLRAVSSWEAAG